MKSKFFLGALLALQGVLLPAIGFANDGVVNQSGGTHDGAVVIQNNGGGRTPAPLPAPAPGFGNNSTSPTAASTAQAGALAVAKAAATGVGIGGSAAVGNISPQLNATLSTGTMNQNQLTSATNQGVSASGNSTKINYDAAKIPVASAAPVFLPPVVCASSSSGLGVQTQVFGFNFGRSDSRQECWDSK